MFFTVSFYLSIAYYRCWGTETEGENLTKLTASVEITQKSHQHHNPTGSPLLLMKCQCRKKWVSLSKDNGNGTRTTFSIS